MPSRILFLIYNRNLYSLVMKNKEDLIYDLIFSETLDYNINISEYIDDIYKYDKFIEDIKNVLRKSKVSVVKEKIDLETEKVIWNLKVKK